MECIARQHQAPALRYSTSESFTAAHLALTFTQDCRKSSQSVTPAPGLRPSDLQRRRKQNYGNALLTFGSGPRVATLNNVLAHRKTHGSRVSSLAGGRAASHLCSALQHNQAVVVLVRPKQASKVTRTNWAGFVCA